MRPASKLKAAHANYGNPNVGGRRKRLIKPVKNFEKKFRFDLTGSPGTPTKGPQGPPKTDFFGTQQEVACEVSLEASDQARQKF